MNKQIRRCIEKIIYTHYPRREEVDNLIANNPGPQGPPGADGQDGADGDTPYIGGNGNWWIGQTDTGVAATGPQGPQGDPGPDLPGTLISCGIPTFTNLNQTLTAGSWQSVGSTAIGVTVPSTIQGYPIIVFNFRGIMNGNGNLQFQLRDDLDVQRSETAYMPYVTAADYNYGGTVRLRYQVLSSGLRNCYLWCLPGGASLTINVSGQGHGCHNFRAMAELVSLT